ncbi:ABC transporter permease [Zunongwangia sp. H14]|uniref:ABC transporter permease n=1 Tax=Zunongwangia sp. H14 TaxID=3240792 RepID=UPI00356143B5
MLRSYIKFAFRNLVKHKIFSIINILGLTIGLTCCMLISLYILHEYSYDNYHKNGDQIYQIDTERISAEDIGARATVPAALAGTLSNEFPEIEETTRLLRLFNDDKTLFSYESKNGISTFYEKKGYVADASFFDMFTYNFLEGNAATALKEPNSIVISEEIAQKIFKNKEAVGNQLRISSSTNGDHNHRVTGVFRPSKSPSHIDGRFFLSVEGGNMEDFILNSSTLVNNNMFYTYLKLKPGSDPEALEAKFPVFIRQHMGKELESKGIKASFFLTPLKQIHLESRIAENVTSSGSKKYLYILITIAILTLVIACINFMNLSTSRSSKRGIEVGIKKVLGAEKKRLLWQFLGESVLMSLIAYLLAFTTVLLFLPVFEKIAGKEIVLPLSQEIQLFAFFLLIAIIAGLFAGSYPAFFLSSFKPIKVLKGKFSNSLEAVSLRKTLVVVQFVIAIALIISSIVIAKQMTFLRSTDLGFQKNQQLIIPLRGSVAKENSLNLKQQLETNPQVKSIGASTYYPGISNPTDWLMYKEGNTMENAKSVFINRIDNSFLQTLEIKPVAGRIFSEEFTGDSENSMVINQTAVTKMGFSSPQDAIGKWMAFDWEGEQHRFEIIGVVKDFHFKDLHTEIEPYGFLLNSDNSQNYLIAQVNRGNFKDLLNSFEKTWKKLIPNEPFEYSFLDKDFQKNYEVENRLATMINYFTLMAIFISCLGLFGLATFNAEQRIREIGLRKVLGASVSSIVTLLSLDFIKLVMLAVLIASPLAWYGMQQWLQTFAYRIDISWQIFAVAILITAVITLITVSFQAIKAALSNPVKNLRTE